MKLNIIYYRTKWRF